mgnify:CR=1 FL=1
MPQSAAVKTRRKRAGYDWQSVIARSEHVRSICCVGWPDSSHLFRFGKGLSLSLFQLIAG